MHEVLHFVNDPIGADALPYYRGKGYNCIIYQSGGKQLQEKMLCSMVPIFRVINTPEVAFEQAVQYLLICMGGTIFVYGYNCMAALLRGVGDSKAPMVIVIITVILNAALDVLLIAVFRLGVVGAALATVICQCASLVLVSLYIKYKTDFFDFKLSSFRIHKGYLSLVIKIGLPRCINCTGEGR